MVSESPLHIDWVHDKVHEAAIAFAHSLVIGPHIIVASKRLWRRNDELDSVIFVKENRGGGKFVA